MFGEGTLATYGPEIPEYWNSLGKWRFWGHNNEKPKENEGSGELLLSEEESVWRTQQPPDRTQK